MKTYSLIAISALSLLAASAHATLIDFNSHSDDGSLVISDSGYNFTTTATGWGVFANGTSLPFGPYTHDGSVRYIATGDSTGDHARVLISAVNAVPFNFTGMDAATAYTSFGNGQIQIIGNKVGGGTVSEFINVTTTFSAVSLTQSYTNLTSLLIRDAVGGSFASGPAFSVDNINVVAAPVPEPASMAALGLGLTAVLRRRRRR